MDAIVKSMKSWQYGAFTAKLEDGIKLVNSPVPAAASLIKEQLLIRVLTVALNPVDYKLPESSLGSLSVRRPAVPGLDYCGLVIATHSSVRTFKQGQVVFGGFSRAPQNGTLSEYTIVAASECALLPSNVDPKHGAAAATAATTALQSLIQEIITKPGSNVFINGGSGGVGTWGLQFAKVLGAKVTTSCSGTAVELCKSLGADEVIDYRHADVTTILKDRGACFDLVIDNIGDTSDLYDLSSTILKPGGAFVQVGIGGTMGLGSMATIVKRSLSGYVSTLVGGHKYYFVKAQNRTESLVKIADWMAEGRVKAVIDSIYIFEEVPQAFKKLKQGHARGKIIIKVSEK